MQTSSSNFVLPISCHRKKGSINTFGKINVFWCVFSTKRNHWFDFSLNFRHFIKEGSLKPNCRLLWCDVDRVRTFDKAWMKKNESNGSAVKGYSEGHGETLPITQDGPLLVVKYLVITTMWLRKLLGFWLCFFCHLYFFCEVMAPAYNRRGPLSRWLVGGLGWWFGILGIPQSNNPFHFRGSQESKPPGPKPPINH